MPEAGERSEPAATRPGAKRRKPAWTKRSGVNPPSSTMGPSKTYDTGGLAERLMETERSPEYCP